MQTEHLVNCSKRDFVPYSRLHHNPTTNQKIAAKLIISIFLKSYFFNLNSQSFLPLLVLSLLCHSNLHFESHQSESDLVRAFFSSLVGKRWNITSEHHKSWLRFKHVTQAAKTSDRIIWPCLPTVRRIGNMWNKQNTIKLFP